MWSDPGSAGGQATAEGAARQSRAIPDPQRDELLAQMGRAPGRALLACYVSSGARASQLLGVRLGDVDLDDGKLWVSVHGAPSSGQGREHELQETRMRYASSGVRCRRVRTRAHGW